MTDILVAVCPSIRVRGIDTLADTDAELLHVLPLDEAIERHWQTDALVACYQVPGAEDTGWPRLNDAAANELAIRGNPVLQQVIALDYDNIDHQDWNEVLWREFSQRFGEAIDSGVTPAITWRYFYTTPRGARLIYVLDKPVSIEVSGDYVRGLIAQWRRAGWSFDSTADQWNRLFWLPRIQKGEIDTSTQRYFRCETNTGAVLYRDHVPLVGPDGKAVAGPQAAELAGEKPTPEQAHRLLWVEGADGREIQTDEQRAMRNRLKGRECFPVMFEGQPLPGQGYRDTTITSFVGQACSLCLNLENVTPEHIYAALLPAVEVLDGDDDTPDWTATLWNKVVRFWGRELQKLEKTKEVVAGTPEEQQDLWASIYNGLRRWPHCPAPVRLTDPENGQVPEQAADWISSHAILWHRKSAYFLAPSGTYSDVATMDKALIPMRIRELGMQPIVPIEYLNDKGQIKAVPLQNILRKHGSTLAHAPVLVSDPTMPGGTIDSTGVLKLPWRAYQHNPDVEPIFNQEVDNWLRLLFGAAYPKAAEWLSWAPAIEDGPICAMSVFGPPSVGKKLLASGLAECFSSAGTFAGPSAFTRFNEELLNSPLIVVDEGFHSGHASGQRSIPDLFRALVAGESIPVEEKHMSIVKVAVPFRVLITANNDSVVQRLTGGLDLDPSDKEALAHRLIHVTADQKAADFLAGLGGAGYTGRKGARWIRGDNGQPSDYVVASHIMHLYSKRDRQAVAGRRFLVEGDKTDVTTRRVFDGTGFTDHVAEGLLWILGKILNEQPITFQGVHFGEGGFCVTSAAVVESIRKRLAEHAPRQMTARTISRSLRNFAHSQQPEGRASLQDLLRKEKRAVRWTRIDIDELTDYAYKHGFDDPGLEKVREILEAARIVAYRREDALRRLRKQQGKA